MREAAFDVAATADDAEALVRKVRAHSPDVAVIDIQMPPLFSDDGLRAAIEIRSIDPPVAVLILSHFIEDRYATELLGSRPQGVGYLLKDRLADVGGFVDAVRRVARGDAVVDPEVVGRLVGRRRSRDPVDQLTSREREVLGLIAEGRSNRGIAEVLVVTDSAVERHVTGIFSKLGLPQDANDHRRVLAVLRYLQVNSRADRALPGPTSS